MKDEEDAFLSKYRKLNEAVVGVIEDYGLVSFIPLHVEVRRYLCYSCCYFFIFDFFMSLSLDTVGKGIMLFRLPHSSFHLVRYHYHDISSIA